MFSSHSTFLHRARSVCVCAYACVWVCVSGCTYAWGSLSSSSADSFGLACKLCVCAVSLTHTYTELNYRSGSCWEIVQKQSKQQMTNTTKKRVQNLHYVIVIDTLLAGFGFVALSILHKGEWKRETERGEGKTRQTKAVSVFNLQKETSKSGLGTSLSLSALTIIAAAAAAAALY